MSPLWAYEEEILKKDLYSPLYSGLTKKGIAIIVIIEACDSLRIVINVITKACDVPYTILARSVRKL